MTASMDAEQREQAEAAIRAKLSAGELAGSATDALRLYGSEVFGFLRSIERDEDLAAEAFAQMAENLWRGLAKFRWDASLRSWIYTIARNALHKLRGDPRRARHRNLGLSELASAEIAVQLRTATAAHRRTEVKDALREIRAQLDPDDCELLLLRLDRRMSWKDIARVRGGDDNLTARAAALRKRYERVRAKIAAIAHH